MEAIIWNPGSQGSNQWYDNDEVNEYVLSALVGWSRIDKCWGSSGECNGNKGSDRNAGPHGGQGCKYLVDKDSENKCESCGCMKWEVIPNVDWVQLGRGCTKCEKEKCGKPGGGCQCQCKPDSTACTAPGKCKCDRKCGCTIGTYRSAYRDIFISSIIGEPTSISRPPNWEDLRSGTNIIGRLDATPSQRRHQCARILLGSVCLIWSGLTYMYWTGKWAKGSPRWNNHILDGSGLDDGTLSQWLQALGFPRKMLNDKGPDNRLDQVINNDFMHKLFLGYDPNNQFNKDPTMNLGGFIHEINKAAITGNVFKKYGTILDQHKRGALFKLYILSCAYFTGLQKRNSESNPRTPRTIREILYWLSALPYSQAYQGLPGHCKKMHKERKGDLKFLQGSQKFTVRDPDYYSHFQAVTQYCPLVLIGIQGGIHSTNKTTEAAIHALYANTECHFTYPTVPIQTYNQVVHYIRALFYQLYFLRKQCAVKVAMGGKWRECRYGSGVVSKGVISWMCLGCNPMDHERKCRVGEMGKGVETVSLGKESKTLPGALKNLLIGIGEVVVQLGNAQEALEKGEKEGIYQSMVIGLVGALGEVVGAVKDVVDKHKSMPLGELKGALEKVIEVVLVVVDKLVEGVEKKKVTGKRAQKALEGAMGKLGRLNRKLYVVLGMNIGLVGKVGKGALEAGRLEVIAANHALQGATLKKLDRSLKNINRLC